MFRAADLRKKRCGSDLTCLTWARLCAGCISSEGTSFAHFSHESPELRSADDLIRNAEQRLTLDFGGKLPVGSISYLGNV
jgi:hypothetical protein